MYGDDLIVYLSCSAKEASDIGAAIVRCLREFNVYTGPRMNVDKSTIILKGPDIQADMERLGLWVSSKVRYLSVMIGDVTPQEVYAKAIVRARFLRDLDLTPSEQVYFLNLPSLTLRVLFVRVRYPTKDIIGQLRSILNMAPGLGS